MTFHHTGTAASMTGHTTLATMTGHPTGTHTTADTMMLHTTADTGTTHTTPDTIHTLLSQPPSQSPTRLSRERPCIAHTPVPGLTPPFSEHEVSRHQVVILLES